MSRRTTGYVVADAQTGSSTFHPSEDAARAHAGTQPGRVNVIRTSQDPMIDLYERTELVARYLDGQEQTA